MGAINERTQQARDWDPLAPEALSDPAATYAELRERCPVAHSDRWGGFWTLTRYDDVTVVAADHQTFTTAVQNLVPASPGQACRVGPCRSTRRSTRNSVAQ
jgi:cytochrome P450